MNSTISLDVTPKMVDRLASEKKKIHSNLKIASFTKSNRMLASQRRMLKLNDTCRFKKHSNLIETNKIQLHKMASSTPLTALLCQRSSFAKTARKQLSLLPRTKDSFFPNKENQSSVVRDTKRWDESDKCLSSQNLESILAKNRMKKHRNLLSYNILRLQKKYNFSRFDLHNLYSMFHTLMTDSKLSLTKFKKGFEVIFNMNNVAIRPQTLEKIFAEQRKLDFESFVDMYSRIDQIIYRQNIIDYVQIIFQGLYQKQKISFEDIIQVMKNRITAKESIDIAKIIFEQLDRNFEQTVSIAQIYQLCHSCETFSKKMYRLYTRQTKYQ